MTFLTYLFGLVIACGVLFLAASFAFGRGEELAPMPPDGTPVELPDDRLASGDDLRSLRLSVVLRGYRMAEVDWVLDQLATQIDLRDEEIARLRGAGDAQPATVGQRPLSPEPPPGDGQPGDRLPGDRLPGDRLPGDRLPGDRLPGDRLPGDRLPGDRLPGDGLPRDGLSR